MIAKLRELELRFSMWLLDRLWVHLTPAQRARLDRMIRDAARKDH
jgi:hypothetical protein